MIKKTNKTREKKEENKRQELLRLYLDGKETKKRKTKKIGKDRD